MAKLDPDWTAPREGQDWRDDELMLAVAWLKSLVPRQELERRIEAAKNHLVAARQRMREGLIVPYFDPSDRAAWYLFQAETFATDRSYWTPDGVMQAVPFLTRIANELPLLLTVKGVEERAARMMLTERAQPDSILFELLVALAYRRGGWDNVEFVPEMPGRQRTPDLAVSRSRQRWSVECKRLRLSQYELKEREIGEELAAPVHEMSLQTGQSFIAEIMFKTELNEVPKDYLPKWVETKLRNESAAPWEDEIATGRIRPVTWQLARKVLSKDDVYFGSSRMIELLSGSYVHEACHSLSVKWRPAPTRPAYAEAIYHASLVSWRSIGRASLQKKARHFRSTLASAEAQLFSDRPGVIHIGIENYAGADVDELRHIKNAIEARAFSPRKSRLRWVYGNYFVPELTTRKDESWAITETMVPYRIGRHKTGWPLPGHLLVSPQGQGRSGVHWDGLEQE